MLYLGVTEEVKVCWFFEDEDLMVLLCPFTHGESLGSYSLLLAALLAILNCHICQ